MFSDGVDEDDDIEDADADDKSFGSSSSRKHFWIALIPCLIIWYGGWLNGLPSRFNAVNVFTLPKQWDDFKWENN